MKEAGLTDVRTSINRRQNTVMQYISTRTFLDLCKGAKQREGAWVTMILWAQTVIEWEKAKARVTETESDSELGTDMEGEVARYIEKRESRSSWAEWSGSSADK